MTSLQIYIDIETPDVDYCKSVLKNIYEMPSIKTIVIVNTNTDNSFWLDRKEGICYLLSYAYAYCGRNDDLYEFFYELDSSNADYDYVDVDKLKIDIENGVFNYETYSDYLLN